MSQHLDVLEEDSQYLPNSEMDPLRIGSYAVDEFGKLAVPAEVEVVIRETGPLMI
jgi:hypothetical protein